MKTKHVSAGLALGLTALLCTAAPAMAEDEWHGGVSVTIDAAEGEADDIGTAPSVSSTCGNEIRATICDGVSWSAGGSVSVLGGEPVATVSSDAEKRSE